MSASLKVDVKSLRRLADAMKSSELRNALYEVIKEKGVLALITQGVQDNFDQQGPGWAPLKAATIRRSVSKKNRKVISKMSDRQLLSHEAKHAKTASGQQYRRILQKTGHLMKSATTPGAPGNFVKYGNNGTIEFGTNLKYAGVHNQGFPKKKIPKREFMVLHPKWINEIRFYVITRMSKVLMTFVGKGGG